jgi:hypothetical protein
MRKQKKPQFECSTRVGVSDDGKRHLVVSIRNNEDEYDGILMVLTPAEAKVISKTIYDGARAMEVGK